MRKRQNNCSPHRMSASTICSVFAAALVAAAATTAVRAEEQPDLVGPPGEFADAVAAAMEADKNMPLDVVEMLVAADALQALDGAADGDPGSPGRDKLRQALEAMDDLQRDAAELFDESYDDFLDLYPLWRMYVLCDDPAERERLFDGFRALLARFEATRRALTEDLGLLMTLEQALLPSNAFQDPTGRVPITMDTAEILRNFDADEIDGEADAGSSSSSS